MAQQQTFHIEIDEGTNYSNVFTITDPTTGIAQNLTGWQARMDVRCLDYNAQESAFLPITYNSATSTTTQGLTLGGTAGTISLNIPPSDTLTANWLGGTTGTYDIFLIAPTTGIATKYIKGFFTIKPSTTKLP